MLIIQRYYFESESQQPSFIIRDLPSCCLSYKDTILKANHSYRIPVIRNTTLLLILQRYYFESESQQYGLLDVVLHRCCLSYKDTILKANHSVQSAHWTCHLAVAYPTKILFWKRITALVNQTIIIMTLLLILQRYYFESESQPGCIHSAAPQCCCLSYKDTILKANHSCPLLMMALVYAVAYPTKILFWKRITAAFANGIFHIVLLLILQRYYFESESQQQALNDIIPAGCCLSYKDTILKANHSYIRRRSSFSAAVAYPTKILFWKRITADVYKRPSWLLLLLILQRYYFESESQRNILIS